MWKKHIGFQHEYGPAKIDDDFSSTYEALSKERPEKLRQEFQIQDSGPEITSIKDFMDQQFED